jgi:hypothetical protein
MSKSKNISNKRPANCTTLSGQHEEIKKFIEQKIGKLDDSTLSGQNHALLSEVLKIQGEMDSGRKLESLKRQQLTGEQARIEQSIATLSAFSQLMIDLQVKNDELVKENQSLKQENLKLRKEVLELGQQDELEQDPQENEGRELIP